MSKIIKIQSLKNGSSVLKVKTIANEKYIIADETGKPLNKLKFVQKNKNLEIYTEVDGKEQQVVTLEDYYAPDMNASVVGLSETNEELAYVYNENDGWYYLLNDTELGFAFPLVGIGAAGAAGAGIAIANNGGGDGGGGTTSSVDTTPPATPSAPTSYNDNEGSVQNPTSTATSTDDTTPGINIGTCLTDTPSLYVDGVKVTSTYDILTGTLTPVTPLLEGPHTLTYTLTDTSGNESGVSPTLSITIDTVAPGTAPATPASVSVPEATNGINSSEASDGVEVLVTLPSDAVAGDVITVSIDGGTAVTHTVTAAEVAAISTPITVTLPQSAISAAGEGAATITTTVTDSSGNVSTPITTNVTIDTVAPGTSPATPASVSVPEATNGINASEASDGVEVLVTLPSDAVAGDVITVSIDGGTAVTHTVTAAEVAAISTPITVTLPQSAISAAGEGAATITTTVTDSSGNVSTPITTNVTIDTVAPGTAPATPASVSVPEATNGINASEASDGVEVLVTLPSDAVAGDVITVSIDGGTAVTHTVTAAEVAAISTPITVTLPQSAISAAGEGAATITTTVTDSSGNVSTPITTNVTIDTVAPGTSPATPASVSVPEATNGINASEASDGVEVLVTLPSDAVAGDVITVSIDGGTAVTHTVTAAEVAAISTPITVTLPQSAISAAGEGAATITTTVTDSSGNVSTPITTNVTIDTVAPGTSPATPASVSVPEATNGINASEASDGVEVLVTLPSDAVAGDVITVSIDGGTAVTHTVTAAEVAAISTPITVTLPQSAISAAGEGAATITTTVTDSSGNVSTPITTNVTIDTTPPTAGTISLSNFTDSGSNTTDNISNDNTFDLTISGNEAGSTVVYQISTDGGVTWTTTTANQSAITDGTYSFRATVTDSAGNSATTPVQSVTIDTTPPTAGTISLSNFTDSGSNTTDNISNDNTFDLTISGNEAGSTVVYQISTDGGVTWTTTTANQSAITDGTYSFRATVTDSAGNSATTPVQSVTIDTTPPAAGTLSLSNYTDSGSSATDNISNDNTFDLTISGQEAGTTVVYQISTDGGVTWTTTTANQSAITDGTYSFRAIVTDVAGNTGTTASSLNYTVDTIAPSATITMSDSALKIGDTSIVTITFSEAVSGFELADLTAENGALSGLTTSDNITWTATFTPTANIEDTTNVISLANTYTDVAGNTGTTASSLNYTVDTIAPSATITMSDSALKIGDTSIVTITFSEAVSGFELADLTAENGALSGLTTSDNITWTATFTPTANIEDTTNVISLANTYTDVAGNTGTTASSLNYTVDTIAPSATITMSDSALKIGDTSIVTITFSEAVSGFELADLTAENGALSGLTTSDNITWTATFTPTANIEDTTNVISLANTYTDVAGNTGTTASSLNYTVDTIAPSATITMSDSALKIGDTSIVTITFSEAVSGFELADLTAENGALSGLTTSDNITWTATFTPTANIEDTTNVISLANTYTDVAGNTGTTASSLNYTVDTIAPSATITMSDSALKIGDTSIVTITFSEAVSGFELADLTAENGALSGLTTSDNITWTATFTPTANIEDTTNVISLANTYTDVAGNTGTTASSLNYTVDTIAPSATITMSDSALKIGDTSIVTITFSEAVSGFELADLTAENGALSGLTTSDNITWTATFTPTANIEDTTNVISLANTYTDVAGNTGTTASSLNYTVDTIAPSATITMSDSALKIGDTSIVTITFSEAVSGFELADLTAENGALSGLTTSDNITWTATFTPTANIEDTTNVISLANTYTDVAGNTGTTASSLNYTVDTIAPSATITMSDSALKIGDTSIVTITFSEAVSGFELADLTAENGALSGLTTSDNITWTATFTPTANIEDTTNVISLANTYTDVAGNTGTTASSLNYTVDTIAPSATITMSDSALKIGDTSIVTITFSEAVSGFELADLTAENGALSGLTTSDNITWTATFTPTANIEDTTNVISLANTYTDVAGNTGTTASSLNYTVDTIAPSATITMSDSALKIGDTSIVTITFSEAVSGFELADLTAENGALSGLTTSDNITWTATFTPTANIEDTTNVISLANTYTDVAGNTGTTASSLNYTVDTIAPSATITMSDSALKIGDTSIVTITFSEAVSGFELADLTAENGALSGLTTSDNITWTATFTPTANIEDTTNVISLANTYTDVAGNTGTTASSLNYTVDTIAPSATITMSDSALKIGDTSIVTITFSEAVSGFELADLTAENGALSGLTTSDNITWTATFTPTANIEDTTNVISLANTYTDVAGNTGTTASSLNYTVDTIAPSATITMSDSALKIGDTSIVTITFSEAVSGFELADLTAENGALSGLTTSDNITWTATFTPTANIEDTTNVISLANTYTDVAGNTGTTASSLNYTVDTIAPSATITMSDSALKIGDTSIVTITFSEAVSGFELADLTAENGALSGLTTSDNITWTATFTPTANIEDTTNVISLANTYTDVAGNTGTTASSLNYTVDTIAPSATITMSDSALKIGDTSIVTITFSEAVSGFELADLTAENGALSGLTTSDNITWTATFTPTANIEDTTNVISLANTYTDVAGNTGTTASSLNYTVDTIAPSATITMSDSALKIGDTSIVTITFSEAVSGFELADLTAENGALSGLTTSDNITWTATFTPTANIEDTTNVISLANTYTDVAGNTGTTASSLNYTVDTIAPSATITMSDSALKIGDTSIVTITFSEAVSGFELADLTAENGALSGLTTSDNITWTATFTPTANIEDTTNVISLANTYTDVAGNTGTTASSLNYTVDTIAPSATITMSDSALKIGDTSIVTITFSEAVSGFELADLTAENGALSGLTTSDNITWTATFTPTANIEDTTNVISLANTYTDVAGNTGTTASSLNYTVDTIAPSATITMSDSALKIGDTSIVTITFSEAVSGFELADLTAENGALSGLTTSDNITWTATFTPTANIEDTTNVISLANTYTDVAGNTGTTASSLNYTVDTIAPSATITMSDSALKIGDTSIVTITFSEAVSGFELADLTAENGALSGLTTSDNITWTATFTPTANIEDTTNVISLANTYTDVAGNTGTTASSLNYTVDTIAPSATITMSDSALKIGDTSIVTITFSEAVSGFELADLTAENGALSGLTTSDNITWTATFTPTANIEDTTNVISLANTYTDVAGNTGTTASSLNYTVDTIAPSATITMSDSALKIGDTSIVTITFSEAVSGFELADLTAENGALSGLTTSDNITWTATFTPTANIEDTTNVISLANTYTDVAGNTGTTASSLNYTVDTIAPSATITMSDSALKIGDTSIVTITFSEAVSGFELADLTAENGALSGLTTSDNITWTATFTPTANIEDTTNVISLANTYTDVAGNTGTTASSLNYTVDTIAPSATITMSDSALKIGDTSIVTITFSEAVSGFELADLTAENGALSGLTTSDNITWTATFTPTANIEDTTNVISLANTYTDVAGNTGTTASSLNYTVDTIAPSATITMSDSALKIGDTSIVTITFSEAVSGFELADLTAENGALSGLTTSDNITWTATFTPTANIEDTTNVISLANTYTDVAGNTGTTASSLNYTVDTIAPSATITMSDSALKIGDTSIVTITFSEAVSGFELADLTAENGALSGLTTSDNITWTATFTPTANIEDTTNVISLANTYTDVAGNTGTTASSLNYTVDTIAPSATITMSDSALKIGDTSIVTITFSEAVSGFELADLTAENGALSGLTTSDNITWTATFTPTANIEDTTNVISLANTYTDVAGNTGTTASSLNYTVDTIAPSATITMSDSALKIGDTSIVTITFSEAVSGFELADLTAENGALSGLTTSDNITWTATFTPTANIEDTTNVISLANTYTDVAGNTGTTASSLNYTVDTKILVPTLALATDSGSSNSDGITNISTINVSNLESGATWEYSVDGGTWIAGTGTSFNASAGIHTYSVRQTDTAGNISTGSSAVTYNLDTAAIAGTLSLSNFLDSGSSSSDNISNDNNFDLTISGNEAGSTVVYEVSTNGGTTWTTTTANQSAITDGTYSFRATVTDVAGNTGTTASSLNYTVDTIAPSATITMSDSALKIGDTSIVTITFSEAVSGFELADLTAENGALSGLTTSDNITWTATFTPTANIEDTTNVISLANTYTDVAGNTGTTASSLNYTVDTKILVPTLALATDSGSSNSDGITNISTINVSNLESGATWEYSVDGAPWTAGTGTSFNASAGTHTYSVRQTDVAGNVSTGSSTVTYVLDSSAPTLTISDNISTTTASKAITYTFQFSEAVSDFDSSDIVITNTEIHSPSNENTRWTAGTFTAIDADTYTYTITPDGGTGTLNLDVTTGSFSDAVGNANTADTTSVDQRYSVIDMGADGKLIHGVQVEGKWYYYWDRSGDGTSANTGSLNGGKDYTTHDILDGIFKYDINGNLDNDSNTDNTYRYATINGVKVALPTYGGVNATATDTGSKAGTAVSNNTTTDNPTYNDLLAIWDSYNGATTGTNITGTPSGWAAFGYWSATTSTSGHAHVNLNYGNVYDTYDTYNEYVALQVL